MARRIDLKLDSPPPQSLPDRVPGSVLRLGMPCGFHQQYGCAGAETERVAVHRPDGPVVVSADCKKGVVGEGGDSRCAA